MFVDRFLLKFLFFAEIFIKPVKFFDGFPKISLLIDRFFKFFADFGKIYLKLNVS